MAKLRFALEVAKDLWSAQGDEVSKLRLVLLLTDPSRSGTSDLGLDGDAAALVIQPGSIRGKIVHLPVRLTSFAVCLMLGGGTTPSARRVEMIGRLRAKATCQGGMPLKDIRDLPMENDKENALVVLVHGLFATDIGTFKSLQTDLQKQIRGEVVGFPHDTVGLSIGDNGRELAEILDRQKNNYSHIYCVAHSRGGLVARSAAVHLAKRRGSAKIERLVTFGTPHEGAELAESPGELLAATAFMKSAVLDWSIAGLCDMLSWASEESCFQGISDLRPATTDRWLARLKAEEWVLPESQIELLAVGGETRGSVPRTRLLRLGAWISRRCAGTAANDLIVTLASSLPLFAATKNKVNCNHFEYFNLDQSATRDATIKFLNGSHV